MPDADDGYSTFFREEFVAVTRVSYLVVGSWAVAQEVAQDAFVEAFARWSKVSGYDRPGAWVRRVAIRRAVRVRARDRRRVEEQDRLDRDRNGEGAPDGIDPELLAMILQLPRSQRAAIALHYLEDLPVAEVAEILGCRESTARVHLHRGRSALASRLSPPESAADPTSRSHHGRSDP